jgi:hypothetical protein
MDVLRKNCEGVMVTFGMAWWLMPYLYTLQFFALLHGTEPDIRKSIKICCRGVYARADGGKKFYPLRNMTDAQLDDMLKEFK